MAEIETLHPLRPFLKNWVWEHGHIGTRWLDCVDGEIKFDDGKKSRFASDEIFYVSLRKDADADAHAAGPTIHEGALARFVRAAARQPEEAGRRRMPAGGQDAWSLAWSAPISRMRGMPLHATRRSPCSRMKSVPQSSRTSGARTSACASNWRCMTSRCFTACPRRCSSARPRSSTGGYAPGRRSRSYRFR
jgi:hypothetical protein